MVFYFYTIIWALSNGMVVWLELKQLETNGMVVWLELKQLETNGMVVWLELK
ncbi:hypothetical protein ACEN33_12285 [Ruoffia sp. FAM 24228]|uniref:hypothetical protein n=1 Tax=unclassified Ruoffia TaxID=2862149 RepID=UPI003887FA78